MTCAFRDAHDWATGATGAGVLLEEGELSWKNKVRKRFDYYYEVVDVMADRAGSMPKCTNDDPSNLDLDDDDDGPDFAVDDDDDDDAEEEDGNIVPPPSDADSIAVVPPPAAAAAAAPPTSGKKDKKQRKRGGRAPLMDDETMKLSLWPTTCRQSDSERSVVTTNVWKTLTTADLS